MHKNINRNSDKSRVITEQPVEQEDHAVGIPKDFSNKAERVFL